MTKGGVFLRRARSRVDAALTMVAQTQGVVAAVLATEDGLPLAVRLRTGGDASARKAAAAAVSRLGRGLWAGIRENAVEVYHPGTYRLLVRHTGIGYLMVLCERAADLGAIAQELEKAAALLGSGWNPGLQPCPAKSAAG